MSVLPANESPTAVPLLAMRNIRKSFGGVEVLKGVAFDVRPGEVHALCGENGAGKSTLMNILAGIHRPDSGEIDFGGRTFPAFASAHAAQQAGVGIVFQERSLFGPLTVAENIFAGRQPVARWNIVDRRRLFADASSLLAQVAPDVTAGAAVSDLSLAQQQMVEIAKALSLDATVIIFDEPTAALTEAETARLFAVIRQLKARRAGVVYISHRLEEIFHIADRVTVLKDGAWQGTMTVAQTSTSELVRLMVGREVEKGTRGVASAGNPVVLDVRKLNDPPARAGGGPRLRDVSFQAREGEIVALAGLAGAGRTETALSLFGARSGCSGETRVDGRLVAIRSPAEAIAAGLAYLGEDRKEAGLFLEMSVRRNVSAARLEHFGRWFFRDREEAAVAERFVRQLRITCSGIESDTAHLSGGNQQKVLLARWLLADPRVLIVDEPTRGVDVGAKAEVHRLLREFAARGGAVVMISSELPEVLAVSDRIYVMRAGRIVGELDRAVATEEAVMRLAAVNDRLSSE